LNYPLLFAELRPGYTRVHYLPTTHQLRPQLRRNLPPSLSSIPPVASCAPSSPSPTQLRSANAHRCALCPPRACKIFKQTARSYHRIRYRYPVDSFAASHSMDSTKDRCSCIRLYWLHVFSCFVLRRVGVLGGSGLIPYNCECTVSLLDATADPTSGTLYFWGTCHSICSKHEDCIGSLQAYVNEWNPSYELSRVLL